MGRWHFEDVLEEESVQLGDLPEDDELADGEESHVRTFRVHPTNRRPTLRRELKNSSLDLTGCRRNIAYPHPLVFAHFHQLHHLEAHPDAESVAEENVEDERIPPALDKVRQKMSELNLSDLPHDTDAPENAAVSNEDAFEGPAEEVSKSEHVKVLVELLDRNVRTVDTVLLVLIDVEVLQLRIEPIENAHDSLVVLEH